MRIDHRAGQRIAAKKQIMNFDKNPLLKSTHLNKLEIIYERFPRIENKGEENVLSLFNYFQCRPEKFFSKRAFENYYQFLHELAKNNFDILRDYLIKKEPDLDIAFKSLTRINSEEIHDIFLPENNIARIRFIDKYIHYNYQRLIEGVYHTFIYLIAFHVLKSENKGTENMNVFNCNQILEKTDFKYLTESYNHTLRNAIAHNDIEFKEREIL